MELAKSYDKSNFPDQPLTGRLKLAYDWISDDIENLLDAGCSYGYSTNHFKRKCRKAYGIDPQPDHIEAAKAKYPEVQFSCCLIEDAGFEDGYFDAVIHTDVLEHTSDKILTLNELHRMLAPGGEFILTTPHKGLFGFLDPYNYGYYMRKYIPFLYKSAYKLIRLLKEGKLPESYNPAHLEKHYHYSLKDILNMLDKSAFSNNYEIEKVLRGGLFLEVFTMNLEVALRTFLSREKAQKFVKPLYNLSMKDYFVDYGIFAYNIALKIRKKR